MQAFTPANVAKVANRPGNYYFYNSRGTMIYAGISEILKHRLQSYYQKDDLSVHRTKCQLRKSIKSFKVVYRPLSKARKVEQVQKQRGRFNFQK